MKILKRYKSLECFLTFKCSTQKISIACSTFHPIKIQKRKQTKQKQSCKQDKVKKLKVILREENNFASKFYSIESTQ